MDQQRVLKFLFLFFLFCSTISCKPITLSEKELKLLSSTFKEIFTRHKIPIDNKISYEGNYECYEDDDCEVTLNTQQITNGVLSGNDILNGLANGNGNDNGNNGNNSGNVILQIFNAPPGEFFPTSTAAAPTTTTTKAAQSTSLP